jgi:hypothetical protein
LVGYSLSRHSQQKLTPYLLCSSPHTSARRNATSLQGPPDQSGSCRRLGLCSLLKFLCPNFTIHLLHHQHRRRLSRSPSATISPAEGGGARSPLASHAGDGGGGGGVPEERRRRSKRQAAAVCRGGGGSGYPNRPHLPPFRQAVWAAQARLSQATMGQQHPPAQKPSRAHYRPSRRPARRPSRAVCKPGRQANCTKAL